MGKHLIACHECDALHYIQVLPEQSEAYCAFCDALLYRHVSDQTVQRSLALHLAALMLFVMANTFPFITLKLAGRVETDMLLSAPMALFQLGMNDLGLLVLLTTIVFPLLTMLAALYLLVPAALNRRAYAMASVFRMLQALMPWSLLAVFMLAVLIAIVKLLDLAEIEVGVSLLAFAILLPVSVMAQKDLHSSMFWPHQTNEAASLSAEPLGRAFEAGLLHCHTCALSVHQSLQNLEHTNQETSLHCPRCGDHVHGRKPNSIARTWALLIAAIVLLLPANILPIMTVTRFGQGDPSTILSGVVHLIAAGMWPLGLIVFFASIMVPVSKLVTLVFLLLSVHFKSQWNPADRTRLYRMTEKIGSWSMVDIFIIGILTSLVSLDALATIEPGIAASYFAASVVLTMFAAQSFDPRLIWDGLDEVASIDANSIDTNSFDTKPFDTKAEHEEKCIGSRLEA
ncbi:paraquat-inducible protein A [Mariprofundus ferrooxydans]|nr:paraquat-inducible protein A [Mariprofundus ferrooxydans]